jgi:hypothetical protein
MKITIETDTECVVLQTFYKGKIKIDHQLPIGIKEVPIKKSKSINYERSKDAILNQTGEFMFIDIKKMLKDIPRGSIGNALRFLYKNGRVQRVGTVRGRSRWRVVPEPKIGDVLREDRKNIMATIRS